MKNAMLALLFCVATPAICQSVVTTPSNPLEPGQTLSTAPKADMDFSKLRSAVMQKAASMRYFTVPKAGAARLWNNAEVDPKIIVHPSQSKLGIQPSGTVIAQNEFPNLELLPIEYPSHGLWTTPTQSLGLKLEATPATRANLSSLHVTSVQVVAPQTPAQ